MILTTTLNKLRACNPGADEWVKLLKYLGTGYDPDAEINLLTVLYTNWVGGLLWALRATVQDSSQFGATLALAFGEQALPVCESQHPDARLRSVIQASRDYLAGKISHEVFATFRRDAVSAAAAASTWAIGYAGVSSASAYAAHVAAETALAAQLSDAVYLDDWIACVDAVDARKNVLQRQADVIRLFLRD